MPPRSALTTAFLPTLHQHGPRLRQSFHTSPPALASVESAGSHYDTLNLSPGATGPEIKKRFYELSKTHHPDRNRNDPGASQKFIAISSAYSVLGNVSSRERYDRDLARSRPSPASASASGSSSAASPRGARPASGLSRRKTRFHGPPPSFYRNGGWATFRGRPHEPRTAQQQQQAQDAAGGFGVGGQASGANDDVPHFDFGQKQRMHEEQQRRWAARGGPSRVGFDPGVLVPALAVSGILLVTVGSTMVFGSALDGREKKRA